MLINKDLNAMMKAGRARNIRKQNDSGIIAAACIGIALLILIFATCALADQINDTDAIKAIIGEAENQGYDGMLAVACAIRNRHTLNGVFGIRGNRVRNKLYSTETLQYATKAWHDSDEHDITNGATHWENIKAFGNPYWARNMIKTFQYRDHVFYKIK